MTDAYKRASKLLDDADVHRVAAKLGKLLNADKGKHRCEPRGSCSLVIFRGVSLSTAMAARLLALLEKAS